MKTLLIVVANTYCLMSADLSIQCAKTPKEEQTVIILVF